MVLGYRAELAEPNFYPFHPFKKKECRHGEEITSALPLPRIPNFLHLF